MPVELRATCLCIATIMLRGGAVVCSACSSPVEAVGDEPSVFRSPHGPFPHGWTNRRFLAHVKAMPGARRAGGARGRSVVWEIDRADFDRALRNAEEGSEATSSPAPVTNIDAWISNAGLRLTRSA